MMKAMLLIILAILIVVVMALFSVYWFDLDAKLLRIMEAKAKNGNVRSK